LCKQAIYCSSRYYSVGTGIEYQSASHRDVVKLMVAKGADINAKDYNGTTPLHEAAWSGHKDVVELLVDNGANVSAKDDESKVVGS